MVVGYFLLGVLAGLCLGLVAGVFLMCALNLASDADDRMERDRL